MLSRHIVIPDIKPVKRGAIIRGEQEKLNSLEIRGISVNLPRKHLEADCSGLLEEGNSPGTETFIRDPATTLLLHHAGCIRISLPVAPELFSGQ